MPIIVLLQLGGSSSPSASYVSNFLTAYHLADAALAALPENMRVPRPFVIGPTGGIETRATNVIASTLHVEPRADSALGPMPNAQGLSKLVAQCLAADRPTIIVTGAATARSFLTELAVVSGRAKAFWPPDRPFPHLGIAVDTDTMEMQPIKMPPRPSSE